MATLLLDNLPSLKRASNWSVQYYNNLHILLCMHASNVWDVKLSSTKEQNGCCLLIHK